MHMRMHTCTDVLDNTVCTFEFNGLTTCNVIINNKHKYISAINCDCVHVRACHILIY